jgi:hypothetical protein
MNKEAVHCLSLFFRNADLERRFQESRTLSEDLPYAGRVLFWAILFVCSARRLQLLLAAYVGFASNDPTSELRLTVVYYSGLVLEFLVFLRPTMIRFRGAISTFTTFWTIIDGSCVYYPIVPGLMPL